MKTYLPDQILTAEQAKAFLTELMNNEEAWHPDDNVFEVEWETVIVTDQEKEKLSALMDQIFQIEEVDPYDTLLIAYYKLNSLGPLKLDN